MANIDTLEEWHLTPNGWIKNTLKTRSSQRDKLDGVPADRLLTIQDWEYERSSWSEMTGGCKYTFISDDKFALKSAIAKHGKAPPQYTKIFISINPIDPTDDELDCDTKRDAKTGKIRERYESGPCDNCSGTGVKGKDRTGDDYPCPKCGGSGKSYVWRDKE